MSLREDSKQLKNLGSNAFNRRRVVGTGAVLSAGIVATTLAGKGVFAQDATPSADGATPAPQSNESSGAQFPKATKLGNAIPPEYTADESNWPSEGQNLKATRYVTKSTISSSTIDKLGVAWNVPISIGAPYGSLVANPVIANGILFQQDAQSNVYALNKETGEKVWTNIYNDAVPSGGPNGVGLGYDMAFFTLGGSAIVVAAKQDTGEEIWRTNIKGYRHEGITMAPLVFDSTVYVSTIPGTPEAFYNGGQRGFIFALDASTGGTCGTSIPRRTISGTTHASTPVAVSGTFRRWTTRASSTSVSATQHRIRALKDSRRLPADWVTTITRTHC